MSKTNQIDECTKFLFPCIFYINIFFINIFYFNIFVWGHQASILKVGYKETQLEWWIKWSATEFLFSLGLLKVTFFYTHISSHLNGELAAGGLAGRWFNAINPSLEHDTACPTLCSPPIKFKSNSNLIKFKAVSNVILAFLPTWYQWLTQITYTMT